MKERLHRRRKSVRLFFDITQNLMLGWRILLKKEPAMKSLKTRLAAAALAATVSSTGATPAQAQMRFVTGEDAEMTQSEIAERGIPVHPSLCVGGLRGLFMAPELVLDHRAEQSFAIIETPTGQRFAARSCGLNNINLQFD